MLPKRVLVVLLFVAWCGCGSSGPRLPDVVVRPGEAVDYEHHVGTLWDQEVITSCAITAGEVAALDVDVYALSIGTHDCYATVSVFAYPDSLPGQYSVPVHFEYAWVDEETEVEGEGVEDTTILVEIRP